jgi:hypothetical protein
MLGVSLASSSEFPRMRTSNLFGLQQKKLQRHRLTLGVRTITTSRISRQLSLKRVTVLRPWRQMMATSGPKNKIRNSSVWDVRSQRTHGQGSPAGSVRPSICARSVTSLSSHEDRHPRHPRKCERRERPRKRLRHARLAWSSSSLTVI